MVRLYRRVNRYVPALSMVFFLLGLAALVINIAYVSSPSFADAFNGGVSSHIRVFLARGLHAGERDLDPDENINLFTLPLDEAVARVMAGEVPDGKTQMALLKAAKYLDV